MYNYISGSEPALGGTLCYARTNGVVTEALQLAIINVHGHARQDCHVAFDRNMAKLMVLAAAW